MVSREKGWVDVMGEGSQKVQTYNYKNNYNYTWECNVQNAAAAAKSLQSCRTLCDPIAGSPPGTPVPGILQARELEWVAISFSSA